MLDLESFLDQFAEVFALADRPDPDDNLFLELGFDSFAYLELLVWLDAIACVEVPDEDLPEVATVRDAFAYYERTVARAGVEQ